MKKIIGLALAGSLLLAGCNQPAPDALSQFIAQVKADALAVCGFVPTAVTVIDLVGSGVPGLEVAGTIANEICTAAEQARAGRFGSHDVSFELHGVRITGHFRK